MHVYITGGRIFGVFRLSAALCLLIVHASLKRNKNSLSIHDRAFSPSSLRFSHSYSWTRAGDDTTDEYFGVIASSAVIQLKQTRKPHVELQTKGIKTNNSSMMVWEAVVPGVRCCSAPVSRLLFYGETFWILTKFVTVDFPVLMSGKWRSKPVICVRL